MSYVKRYAPVIYNDNSEMQALYTVQNQLYTTANEDGKKLFRNRFIISADESAVRVYEKMYDVYPDYTITLEQRRQKIIDKIIFRPPFTRQRLTEILEHFYGKGKYSYEIYPSRYEVIINIDTDSPINYMQYNDNIRALLPSNIKIIYDIQFTYVYLIRNMTHMQLSRHTYGGLSQFAKIE